MRAAETLSAEDAAAKWQVDAAWIEAILARIEPHVDASPPLRVLDIGAAQGRAVAALVKLGHDAVGVEPHEEAVAASKQLAKLLDCRIDVRPGRMEQIPFDDASFDVVIATSVVEHVEDVDASFGEVHRVLRPGGVFWFNTASSMCPRQSEIAHVPLFGWYPLPLKRAVMRWAKRRRPAWIGHTDVPAMHWFTPRSASRRLRRAGFDLVLDRWQLRLPSEDRTALHRVVMGAARRWRLARLAGDVVVPGCSYLARRP